MHKTLVDLEFVKREVAQLGEGRSADAKIIDR
jgi:hypothetical protein